jgi:two-component system LytT family response regulator
MYPITCVVVDDEPLARSAIRRLVAADSELSLVGEASDGEEAFEAISNARPQLLFLDIQMPEMSGIELLQRLRGEGIPIPAVVFTTAWDRYAVQAFEEQAADYLMKPIDDKRFMRAVAVAKARIRAATPAHAAENIIGATAPDRIAVRSKGRITLLPLEHID